MLDKDQCAMMNVEPKKDPDKTPQYQRCISNAKKSPCLFHMNMNNRVNETR